MEHRNLPYPGFSPMTRILPLLVIFVIACFRSNAQDIKSGKITIRTLYKDKNMTELRDLVGPVEFDYYGDYLMELLKSASIKDTFYTTESKPPKRSVQERDIGFFLINLKRKLFNEYKATEIKDFTLIHSDSLTKKNKGAEVPTNGRFFSKRDETDIRKELRDTLINGKSYRRVQFTNKAGKPNTKIIYFVSKTQRELPEALEELWYIDECGGGLVAKIHAYNYEKSIEILYNIDFFPNTLSKEEAERFKKYIKDFN